METEERLKAWRKALGEFLTQFDWQLYMTPSFRFPVTLVQAQRDIHEWVTGFGHGAYAYVAYEKGHAGGRTHTHVLLGGLNLIGRRHASRLWTAGGIKAKPFDPKRGACWYVAKFPAEGEIVGTLRRRTQMARARFYARS